MSKLVVRKATLKDDPALVTLAKRSPFTKDFASILFVRKNLAQLYARGGVGVALLGRKPVGFMCCNHLIRKPHSSVYYMGVAPEAHGQGVGKALVRWALEGSPWSCLELICEHRNEGALKFYKRLGFKALGEGATGSGRTYTRFELRGGK